MNSTVKDQRLLAIATGVLMYLSTTFFFSNALLILVLLVLLLFCRPEPVQSRWILLALFALGAIANILTHVVRFDISRHASSFAVVLVPLAVALVPRIPVTALRTHIVLCAFETLVGWGEFIAGRTVLFKSQMASAEAQLSVQSNLLYDLRVFGLSTNSSVLAEKILISILLISLGLFTGRRRVLLLLVFAGGLFVTFNRSALLAVTLFILLQAVPWGLRRVRNFITAAAMAGVIAVYLALNLALLQVQFMRGGTELSYSELSRFYFWERGLLLLSENPFVGNGSLTWRIEDPITGIPQHAHNSLVMLTVTHGTLLASLVLLYIASNINRRNFTRIAAIFAFSMTQYCIFWNLSLSDLMFYWVLLVSAHFRPDGARTVAGAGPWPVQGRTAAA